MASSPGLRHMVHFREHTHSPIPIPLGPRGLITCSFKMLMPAPAHAGRKQAPSRVFLEGPASVFMLSLTRLMRNKPDAQLSSPPSRGRNQGGRPAGLQLGDVSPPTLPHLGPHKSTLGS